MAVEVVGVIDGDTLIVQYIHNASRTFRLRLFGIDAPENDQPYGTEATEFLTQLALNQRYRLHILTYTDRYGRVVGVLYTHHLVTSVNHTMVSVGLAYAWPDYGKLPRIDKVEQRAKRKKLGVWQQPQGGIRPWDWRQSRPVAQPSKSVRRRQPPTPAQPSRQPRPEQKRVFQRPPSEGPGCLVALFALVISLINRK